MKAKIQKKSYGVSSLLFLVYKWLELLQNICIVFIAVMLCWFNYLLTRWKYWRLSCEYSSSILRKQPQSKRETSLSNLSANYVDSQNSDPKDSLSDERIQKDEKETKTFKLSILIVTNNDARVIGETLRTLESNTTNKNDVEIIIIDMASKDCTLEVAKGSSNRIPVKFVKAEKLLSLNPCCLGKGGAYNIGYDYITGDIMFLLHPDALVSKNYDEYIRQTFQSNQDIQSLSFRIKFQNQYRISYLVLYIFELFLWMRSVRYHLYHPLQGLCIKSSHFQANKFTSNYGLCDEIDYASRLQSSAIKSKDQQRSSAMDQYITYSSKKWDDKGIFKYILLDQIIATFFCFSFLSIESINFLGMTLLPCLLKHVCI